MGKGLRKRTAGKSAIPEDQVLKALADELEKQLLCQPINPLIGMAGMSSWPSLLATCTDTYTAVNIHMDTPTEILHTILLGIVKYFWAQTVFLLDKSKHMGIFETRLASFDTNGLNSPSISAEYMCRYKGSLIGKHFKSLAQIMPFLIYDLVPATVLEA